MSRRGYWLCVSFSVLASFSWVLWCWHDPTHAGYWGFRDQTKEDHVAAIGFALARVVLALFLLELPWWR